jgi:hypothetical protein
VPSAATLTGPVDLRTHSRLAHLPGPQYAGSTRPVRSIDDNQSCCACPRSGSIVAAAHRAGARMTTAVKAAITSIDQDPVDRDPLPERVLQSGDLGS